MPSINFLIESGMAALLGKLNYDAVLPPDAVLSINQGFTTGTMTSPAVIIHSEDVTTEAVNLGVYHVPLNISVYAHAADNEPTQFDNLYSTVFNAATAPSVQTGLPALTSGLAIYDIIYLSQADAISADAWEKTLRLEIIAALTN